MKSPVLEKVCLEVLRHHMATAISVHELECMSGSEISAYIDREARRLVMDVRTSLMSDSMTTEKVQEDQIQVPDGWWQAVRERWLPKWWLRRWPVRYRSIVTETVYHIKNIRVCPHMRVPMS